MFRLAFLLALGLATLGCSSSRRVVVQNGYPGVQPPVIEARPAPLTPLPPGPIRYAPDAQGSADATDPAAPAAP